MFQIRDRRLSSFAQLSQTRLCDLAKQNSLAQRVSVLTKEIRTLICEDILKFEEQKDKKHSCQCLPTLPPQPQTVENTSFALLTPPLHSQRMSANIFAAFGDSVLANRDDALVYRTSLT